MRLYWELARRGYRRHATYRSATFARIFTGSVFGLIRAYVMVAVYRHRADINGFDVADAVTFAIVSQGLLSAIEAFGTDEIAQRVRTGDIVTDLYRPVDFQQYSLAQDMGRAVFHLIFRGVPPVLVGALVFNLKLTTDPTHIAAALVSVLLGAVVAFDLRFLVNLSAFWLLDIRGPLQMLTLVQMFFAGLFVPITFFPHGLETVARALPFVGLLQAPVEIAMGKHAGGDLVATLGLQVAWAVALYAAGKAMLSAATTKVVVQGG